MNRLENLECLQDAQTVWDFIIVGGGATGLGIAIDAASRGFKTVLIDRDDFAKGTSSRSTKLIHGGVRYLRQGHISLVFESVKERGLLCDNAPHLVHPLPFLVPAYHWYERCYYGIGLKLYDMMAGRRGLAPTRILSRKKALIEQPGMKISKLRGGVRYFDAQFDDARLAISMARTAVTQGACLVNHVNALKPIKDNGKITGLELEDTLSGKRWSVNARVVVNATGPFSDALRQEDRKQASAIIAPSQGIHLVLGKDFLPGSAAIMVPKTDDGRVLFAIPWLGKTILGTTDTPVPTSESEPRPQEEEIEYLLEHAGRYLERAPTREDICAIYTGLRPLVAPAKDAETKKISREHTIEISPSGLFTICGGKWTTYRKMAEDAVDRLEDLVGRGRHRCSTEALKLDGYSEAPEENMFWRGYGIHASAIRALAKDHPEWLRELSPGMAYCEAQLRWAVREEMACTIEDLLARRTRILFLDAEAALRLIPLAQRVLQEECGLDEDVLIQQASAFQQVAEGYRAGSGE